MKQMVLNVLGQTAITRIALSFGPIAINALSFEPVKQALKKGTITVKYSSKTGANHAKYSFSHNRFTLGFKKTRGSMDREALIAHEAVHAALDAKGVPRTVKQSEAAAFLFQCLYFYYRNETAFKNGAKPTFKNKILKAAWPISQICVRRTRLTASEVEPLYKAIAAHKIYKGRENDKEAFDGV